MPRKQIPPTPPADDQGQPDVTVYQPSAAPVISNPLDEILMAYHLPANTLCVEVLRSHDRLYEGEIAYLPNDDRTAGLISGGYVQLVPPPILGVETYQ